MHQSIGRHIVVLHDCFCGFFFFWGSTSVVFNNTHLSTNPHERHHHLHFSLHRLHIYQINHSAKHTHTNISSLLFFLGGSSFSILIRLDYFIPNRNLRYQHPLILRSTFTPQIHSFFHIANLFPDFLSTYMFLISSFLRPRSIENPSAFVFSSLSSF